MLAQFFLCLAGVPISDRCRQHPYFTPFSKTGRLSKTFRAFTSHDKVPKHFLSTRSHYRGTHRSLFKPYCNKPPARGDGIFACLPASKRWVSAPPSASTTALGTSCVTGAGRATPGHTHPHVGHEKKPASRTPPRTLLTWALPEKCDHLGILLRLRKSKACNYR